MLLWINGTFGVGKTHTAHEVRRKIPGSVVADPELLGFGLQRMYPKALRTDFQETPWWAPTTAAVLADIVRKHPGDVIVPMTLADDDRRRSVFDDLLSEGVDLRHVALLASRATVRSRLRLRLEGPGGWALQAFEEADAGLRRSPTSEHLETDGLSLPDVVERMGRLLGQDLSYSSADRLGLPFRRGVVTLRHLR